VLGRDRADVHRVTFTEITKKAVLAALEHPTEIDLTWSTPSRPGACSTG